MNAEILTIGNELLYGETVDTNAAGIAQELAKLGITVAWMTSVGDIPVRMTAALDGAMKRADVVMVTGGLGPTDDDITRDIIAAYFHTELVFHEPSYEQIRCQFKERQFSMTSTNKVQAYVPKGCTVMKNTTGNAPGYIIKKEGKHCFVMPGVPREMDAMLKKSAVPFLSNLLEGKGGIIHRTLRTTGIGESTLFDRIKTIEIPCEVTIAYLPQATGVDLRLTIKSPAHRVALRTAERQIRTIADEFIYATDSGSMEMTIGELLCAKGLMLAVAESCSGGYLSDRITSVSGSSRYFQFGAVTYSNEAKIKMLGVSKKLITAHGAVSEEVAGAMAEGVRKAVGADIGISTTGIAGPTGGTLEKPVGTVCLSLSTKKTKLTSSTVVYSGDRGKNKIRFAQAALRMLLNYLRQE